MYSAKISNSLSVNNKTGETRLNDIEVKIDGFSDPDLLEKAKQNYNADKEIKEKYKAKKKWPEEDWNEIYESMMRKLRRWRNYTEK